MQIESAIDGEASFQWLWIDTLKDVDRSTAAAQRGHGSGMKSRCEGIAGLTALLTGGAAGRERTNGSAESACFSAFAGRGKQWTLMIQNTTQYEAHSPKQ